MISMHKNMRKKVKKMIEIRKKKTSKEKLEEKLSYAASEITTLLMKHFREYCVTNHLDKLYENIITDVDYLCDEIVEEFVENGDF